MTNRIAVTAKDMRRYELLHRVVEGQLTLAAVAPVLGVSYRHAKRLKAKVGAGGLAALAHGNRARVPSNKPPDDLRRRVLALAVERYADFNDTHFTELLAEREGLHVSREAVRRWRREAGHKPKRARRAPKHRRRRERKPAAGRRPGAHAGALLRGHRGQ